jgi:hypothetical protein
MKTMIYSLCVGTAVAMTSFQPSSALAQSKDPIPDAWYDLPAKSSLNLNCRLTVDTDEGSVSISANNQKLDIYSFHVNSDETAGPARLIEIGFVAINQARAKHICQ